MDIYNGLMVSPPQVRAADNYEQLQVLEKSEQELEKEERLKLIKRPLLAWYQQHARVLPWREDPSPYRVWISEIMLQQTRVEAVKPYFKRFMDNLPEIQALASVSEETLLKLWEGLGYYNRAKNLKKTAQIVMADHGGELPESYDDLLLLPGIGSYTAGAIASIAFGIPVPAVDGNVLRVLSRVLASFDDILKQSVKKKMEQDLYQVIPADRAGDYNQALIEIGAIVCVPNGAPKCEICPLYSLCLGRKHGFLDEIPVKSKKKARKIEEKTVFLIEYENGIALNKRPDTGLLASLYEFPNVEGHLMVDDIAEKLKLPLDILESIQQLPESKHIFSHVEWHMKGYRIKVREKWSEFDFFVSKQELKEKYALPNAFHTYMMEIN